MCWCIFASQRWGFASVVFEKEWKREASHHSLLAKSFIHSNESLFFFSFIASIDGLITLYTGTWQIQPTGSLSAWELHLLLLAEDAPLLLQARPKGEAQIRHTFLPVHWHWRLCASGPDRRNHGERYSRRQRGLGGYLQHGVRRRNCGFWF